MELNLIDRNAADTYKILSSLVTPRPIAWITSLNADGSVNAAPFSFFNVFGSRPPMVAFAPGNRPEGVPKDTARNVMDRKEFVIHMVDESLADAMNRTAASLPVGTSELDGLGLELLPSSTVSVPRIARAKAALECSLHGVQLIGENRLVIGIVQCVHVEDGLMDSKDLRLDQRRYHPIGRMASPDWYCRTSDLFELERP